MWGITFSPGNSEYESAQQLVSFSYSQLVTVHRAILHSSLETIPLGSASLI